MAEVSRPPEYARTTRGPIRTPPGLEVYASRCINIQWGRTGARPGAPGLRQSGELLNAGLDGPAGALAFRDDENGVVPRDGADDLRPPGAVDGHGQGLRGARRGFQYEQWPDTVDGDEHGGEELLQVRPRGGADFVGGRVVGRAIGRRHLGEPQLPDVPGEGRLRDVEPLRGQELAQLLLAAHGIAADHLENGGVALGFHATANLAFLAAVDDAPGDCSGQDGQTVRREVRKHC